MHKLPQKLKLPLAIIIPLFLVILLCPLIFLIQAKFIPWPGNPPQTEPSSQFTIGESPANLVSKNNQSSESSPETDSKNNSKTTSDSAQNSTQTSNASKRSQNGLNAALETQKSQAALEAKNQAAAAAAAAAKAEAEAKAKAEAEAKAAAEAKAKALQTAVADLDAYLGSQGYHVSIAYYNLVSQYSYQYNPAEIYYGASLIKTLDALYVYEHPDLIASLKPLVKSAIEVSSNPAHLSLVSAIGLDNLRSYAQALGASEAHSLTYDDCYGNTTVSDQLLYLTRLYNFINNPAYDPSLRSELQNYFINDFYNYLTFPGSPTIMHKYGSLAPNFHEAAIVLDDRPYLVVILSRELSNAHQIFTDLSARLYQLHQLT